MPVQIFPVNRPAPGVLLLKRGIEIAADDIELKPYAHRATRILQIAETK